MRFLSLRSTKGASLTDYMIVLGLIGVVAIPAVSTLGGTVRTTFTDISETTQEAVFPVSAPPTNGGGGGGGGGQGTPTPPYMPTGACVEVNDALAGSLVMGSVSVADLGITDCINVAWDAGYMDLSGPAFASLTGPIRINVGTGTLAGSGTISMVAPSVPVSIVFEQPAPQGTTGYVEYNGTEGVVHYSGVSAADVTLTPLQGGWNAAWANAGNVDIYSIGGGNLDGMYASGNPHPSFTRTLFNGTWDVTTYGAFACFYVEGLNGYDYCPNNITVQQPNFTAETDSFSIVARFLAENGGVLSRSVDFSSANNGDYFGFNVDSNDRLLLGYWQVPDGTPCNALSPVAPPPTEFFVTYTNGTETLRLRYQIVARTFNAC